MQKNRKCSLWWCDRKHYALGYCKAHWTAIRRFGTPYGKRTAMSDKMQSIIEDARALIEAVYYPIGDTRDDMLLRRAEKLIKNIEGS